jgi:hypothetical protein
VTGEGDGLGIDPRSAVLKREQQRFPTRNYPYKRCRMHEAVPPDAVPPAPNVLHRRVIGLDAVPRPMTADELTALDDPVGRLLRAGRPFPLTLRALIAALDGLANTRDALPKQLVFLVAEGGHIPWSPATDALARGFRLVVARGAADFSLLVSSSTRADSSADEAFLQIIGWDATHSLFHYYERLSGTFFWAGQSPHALAPPTRGQGPFDSHVNGSLVMKELRAPWVNWHAPLAGINADALAPHDPFATDPLFVGRVTAERLETEVVRPGIRRWTAARIRGAVTPAGAWENVPAYLRQIVSETTVNLVTADTATGVLAAGGQLKPPLSFFINRDILFDTLDLSPDDADAAAIAAPAEHYLACLARYDVHRTDGRMRVEGDTHFPFMTPEPAFEDTELATQLIAEGMLSARFVACLTMVDFPNPVFSKRRATLLAYVPERVEGGDLAAAFETAFVAAVAIAIADRRSPAAQPGSPEREFLSNWATPNHEMAFRDRITAYLAALRAAATDADAVDGWFRLAEHRRRLFRGRPLAEFDLTTPQTSIPLNAPALAMGLDGRATPIAPREESP